MTGKDIKDLFSREYTIIFVPNVTEQFKRYSFPRVFIHLAFALLAVFFSALGYFGYLYNSQHLLLVELDDLRKERAMLTLELNKLGNQANEMSTQLARIEQFDKKLRVITAMEGSAGAEGRE
ncbi:MAG: hypothetical protein OEZ04_11615, partial [Nitrospinota bacterium]|nr:hypothetical protein [Nitrospinota bacterium]